MNRKYNFNTLPRTTPLIIFSQNLVQNLLPLYLYHPLYHHRWDMSTGGSHLRTFISSYESFDTPLTHNCVH